MDLETRVLELCKQVQNLQERLDDIETRAENDSNGTENLIVEEVHWFFKICRNFFCYG